MNVDLLSVTLGSADRSSNNDQLVLGDEVTDASFVLAAAGGGSEVEFEGSSELDEDKEEAENAPQRNW